MAAPAAAAAASAVSYRFQVIGGWLLTGDGALNLVPGRVSPPFAAITTWMEVVRSRLDSHPDDRHARWTVRGEDKSYVIGTDIPLGSSLAAWTELLDSEKPAVIRISSPLTAVVVYEQLKWALAAYAADLRWPLWDSADTDPLNLERLGSWDGWGSGPMNVPRERDNNMPNLIGLRNRGVVKFVNIHGLSRWFRRDAGNGGELRDPVFRQLIEDKELFMLELAAAEASWRTIDRFNKPRLATLLPILDLRSNSMDRKYGAAFAAEAREAERAAAAPSAAAQAEQAAREAARAAVPFQQDIGFRLLFGQLKGIIDGRPARTLEYVRQVALNNYESRRVVDPRSVEMYTLQQLLGEVDRYHAESNGPPPPDMVALIRAEYTRVPYAFPEVWSREARMWIQRGRVPDAQKREVERIIAALEEVEQRKSAIFRDAEGPGGWDSKTRAEQEALLAPFPEELRAAVFSDAPAAAAAADADRRAADMGAEQDAMVARYEAERDADVFPGAGARGLSGRMGRMRF